MGFVQVNRTVEADLRRAELIAFPILFALLLLFFRGLVAAVLPLLTGALAIAATLLGLRIASEETRISVFAVNLVITLGLGLAMDHGLLIVTRYREELARLGPGREALRRTLSTAGRTVVFSALIVAGAMASLLVFPQPFLYSTGLGGMLVALSPARSRWSCCRPCSRCSARASTRSRQPGLGEQRTPIAGRRRPGRGTGCRAPSCAARRRSPSAPRPR